MARQSDLNEIRNKERRIVLLIVFLILIAWIAIPIIVAGFFYTDLEQRGLFGDSYGALNSLFSGLAFVGIIYTILLQKQELRDTRAVLESQKAEFEQQNETLRVQRFENSLFQMLSMQRKIVEELRIDLRGRDPKEGTAAIKIFYTEILDRYHQRIYDEPTSNKILLIKSTYQEIYDAWGYALGHYFRNLYRIFKFIHESKLIDDKQFYAKIVRAQLSDYELGLLFYNCFASIEGAKFLEYIEEYELLDNLPSSYILDKEHPAVLSPTFKAFGNKSPFGSN